MRSIVLLTLSLLLGTFFIFIGSLKVTQLIHREMHREIRRNFIQYVKVFPIKDKWLGFKLTPKFYRLFVGYLEIICGSLLVALPNNWKLKNVSTVILIMSNLLSLYTHYKLNDKFERLAPSIVFSLMLVCRLIVYMQVKKRTENEYKTKEREERRKLIESGEFDLDQLSLSATDDDETIEDISDDELERLIKLSRKINKKKKSISEKEQTNESDEIQSEHQTEMNCAQESRLLEPNENVRLISGDETKKSI